VYDEAKRYAEALTMAYHRQQGVDTAIVRIFNTYGPRMSRMTAARFRRSCARRSRTSR
jgi:nucleoside-diphosphate-sugar epimerase